MYLTLEELKTHLYDEQIEAISGADETILTAAIDGATQEAKGYLHKFNIPVIFGQTGASRNALLVIFVKDIAIWHYINLANPGTDYKSRQDRYNRAVSWLKSVQSGEVVPDLPIADQGENTAGSVSWNSNLKRENYI